MMTAISVVGLVVFCGAGGAGAPEQNSESRSSCDKGMVDIWGKKSSVLWKNPAYTNRIYYIYYKEQRKPNAAVLKGLKQ